MTKQDDYTRKYMGGDRVRFLDKVRIPGWMHALLLSSGALGATAMVVAHAPFLAPFLALPSLATWALLSTIRVAVTDTHVHLQYGVFGPKVALADIVSVEAIDYQWWRYGGWGIRMALGGSVAYSIPGRGGRAVKVVWRHGKKQRQLIVTSEQATALAAAIDEARTAAATATRTLEDARADVLPALSPTNAVNAVDVVAVQTEPAKQRR